MSVSIVPDSLSTGLVTTPVTDSPVIRVSWIQWDSGFRGSGLAVGDQIIGINGTPLTLPSESQALAKMLPQLPGQYDEAKHWTASGAKDGDAITLRVRRKAPGRGWSELDIRGRLQAERVYDGDSGRTMGPGGPAEFESDGFSDSWPSWHDNAVSQWRQILDTGPLGPQYITDPAIVQQQQMADRVALLVKKYPGPFANAVSEDFATVNRILEGRTYPIAPGDLAYREIGEKRQQQIAAAASDARAAFLKEHAGEMIPPFPSIDPILGDRSKVAGKLVELPTVGSENWIAQGDRTWFTFGQDNEWYFAEGESEATRQILVAQRRYEESVSPDIRAQFSFIGRVLKEPTLVVIDDAGCFGLKVEPVAASIGDAMFVDLTTGGKPALFAGEQALQAALKVGAPANDAPPETVLNALFLALKMGEEELWSSLFADWTVLIAEGELPIVEPGVPPSLEAAWTSARHEILGRAADVRVSWVDNPVAVVSGKEFEGAPRIEEVLIEVEHLRVKDTVFQVFQAVGYTRFWTLQRINDGPWRVTSVNGI